MVSVRKKENESASALLFRFTKKVKQSGILKEAKKRRFRVRPTTRRQRRISAIHREYKKREYARLSKLGIVE